MATVVDSSINYRGHTKLPFYQSELRRPARERAERPWTAETLLPVLDEAGVDKGVLLSSIAASGVGGEPDAIHADELVPELKKAPDRLFGYVGINPTLPINETLRYIDYAVGELGFRGVHVYPHWWGIRIDDRRYWPIYAKCEELGAPIMLQVGSPTPRNRAMIAAKPSWLDPVAYDFPNLTILGIHIGTPVSQNSRGHLLGHVRDEGRTMDDPNARAYQTRAKMDFHSDQLPVDILGLFCVRTAKQGGASALTSVSLEARLIDSQSVSISLASRKSRRVASSLSRSTASSP